MPQEPPDLDTFFRPSFDETVRSHDDLIDFVAALRADRVHDHDNWQWDFVAGYVDGIAACLDAHERRGLSPSGNRWSDIAGLLYAGKIYE